MHVVPQTEVTYLHSHLLLTLELHAAYVELLEFSTQPHPPVTHHLYLGGEGGRRGEGGVVSDSQTPHNSFRFAHSHNPNTINCSNREVLGIEGQVRIHTVAPSYSNITTTSQLHAAGKFSHPKRAHSAVFQPPLVQGIRCTMSLLATKCHRAVFGTSQNIRTFLLLVVPVCYYLWFSCKQTCFLTFHLSTN